MEVFLTAWVLIL